MKEKGLSPVIATTILIGIAVVLASIIFLWARGFLAEATQKQGEPIESSCAEIDFDAEAYVRDSKPIIDIVNEGNIPLYGIEVLEKDTNSISSIGSFGGTIGNGETRSLGTVDEAEGGSSGYTFATGKNLLIIPVIVGEADDGTKRAHTCSQEYGLEIQAT